MRQNLAWSIGYNLTALPLAALGLVPAWVGAIGMSLSSVLVVPTPCVSRGGAARHTGRALDRRPSGGGRT